jgi:hypothetical protein
MLRKKLMWQGLKPIVFQPFTARLKSCPDTKQEFFRGRFSRAAHDPK